MTYEQAVETLRERGWCCSPQHPYSAFKSYLCGPRLATESYGPFPDGFVNKIFGQGDTFVEAVEQALQHQF